MATTTGTTTSTVIPNYAERVNDKKYKWMLDENAMLSKSSFKIKPQELIAICKEVIDRKVGIDNPDDLAEDFTFQFPIIGPLTKEQYIEAVSGFKIEEMFPDLNQGVCNFYVDPFQPNRVWYTVYFRATNTGDSKLFGKATGKLVECPPQVNSLTFNEDGKVIRYTGGYVIDRTIGNSGGMGGLFGPLYAIGKPFPFPEGKPFRPSLQFRFFTLLQTVIKTVSGFLYPKNNNKAIKQ